MKKGLTLFAAILALTGCNPQKKNETGDVPNKSIVIYYSQTGATQKVAQEIANIIEADTFRIDITQPYDGSYQETIERCQNEMANNERPVLKESGIDITAYDTIYLGYPIWFGTYAPPIASLLEKVCFDGKKIIPFCTFGSGGLETSMEALKKALPKAEILPGFGIRNARINKSEAEVEYFLKENGYIEGQVDILPEYSAQQPVTENDIAIFNAACANYTYPLGTPVSVGKRTTVNGTDYRFTARSKDSKGNDVDAVIYVKESKNPNTKPEFTKVVR